MTMSFAHVLPTAQCPVSAPGDPTHAQPQAELMPPARTDQADEMLPKRAALLPGLPVVGKRLVRKNFAQQSGLLLGEQLLLWQHHVPVHEHVALLAATHAATTAHAFSAEHHTVTRLRPSGNRHLGLTVQSGDGQRRAEERVEQTHGLDDMHVLAGAEEDRMIGHAQQDEQVRGRPSLAARWPLPDGLELHPVVYAFWDIQVDGARARVVGGLPAHGLGAAAHRLHERELHLHLQRRGEQVSEDVVEVHPER
eukprot:CAMPEP_0180106762 /NCGR_PEP_ID=MMETSP0985-20121206/32876_1 /TAXON_ID=483367 /ORGANISM="non described non described, Strain CCMP 2436" /LENGTH=251 /DNA_ID=CAMNT_0022044129 /DNA_START=36 /DNA_END=789 /DNA_ORIENTATION=+